MKPQGYEDLVIGFTTTYSQKINEVDVNLFAKITGDNDPIHTDEAAASATEYGKRIVQGALIIGCMMAASTKVTEGISSGAVSIGFDRVRHVAPVFLGDTITVRYEIVSREEERKRAVAAVSVINQYGVTVAVAEHIIKVLS